KVDRLTVKYHSERGRCLIVRRAVAEFALPCNDRRDNNILCGMIEKPKRGDYVIQKAECITERHHADAGGDAVTTPAARSQEKQADGERDSEAKIHEVIHSYYCYQM